MLESYRQRETIKLRAEMYKEMEPGGKYEGLYIDPEIVEAKWKTGAGGFFL